jgi:hypothetical protein
MGTLTRRQMLGLMGRAALASPFLGLLSCGMFSCGGGGSATPPPPPGGGYTGTDDQLLDEIERAAFQFFWNEAGTTGLMKDRALAAGGDTRTMGSIAATGFGLAGLCIADHRGYATNIKPRVVTVLQFLLNQAPQQNGWFYHFMDINTGQRWGTSELSSIDSAILLCGILTARSYFNDATITSLADQIYGRINFQWMLNGGSALSMGWTPENGFISARWDMYAEEMMLYLLGLGAPANSLPPSAWNSFARPTVQFQGYQFIASAAPLFIHQFSHAFFDFRNKQDAYANYFQNSVTATQAHKAFCVSLNTQFSDYSANLWGITSSDSAHGYVAWGGPPATGPIDGTVVPCAAAGSTPFVYPDCLAVLRNIRGTYPNAWRKYGFVDAFNPLTGWYDPDVIGIDLGISMLMAENARTGFVWQTFMQNPEANAAMALAGFH